MKNHGKFCPCCNPGMGIFLVRLALAAVFISHGVQKLSAMDAVVKMFASWGIPAALAWVTALVELLGGIAMLLGVWTKYAGYLLAFIMLVAIWKVKAAMGFFGGWEYDLTLLLAALGVAFAGAGSCTIGMGHTCGEECKSGCIMKK